MSALVVTPVIQSHPDGATRVFSVPRRRPSTLDRRGLAVLGRRRCCPPASPPTHGARLQGFELTFRRGRRESALLSRAGKMQCDPSRSLQRLPTVSASIVPLCPSCVKICQLLAL